MNLQELELKPSLINKFGLYVEVEGSKNILERMNIIKNVLNMKEIRNFFRNNMEKKKEF
ncbi:MAG TPA: hypothetical protein VIG61_01670 [Fusobacterium sp.]|uniref:hypothetical protein n=1 Tax=Fusobacterium sp. TaxID=68766 RepID=UPI002F410C1D